MDPRPPPRWDRVETVGRAVERHAVYGIGFRDAAHLAAAEEAGCDARASEDFTAGRYYGGLVAVDPMSPSP